MRGRRSYPKASPRNFERCAQRVISRAQAPIQSVFSGARPKIRSRRKIVLDRDQAMRLIDVAEGQVLVLIVMAATLAIREGELFAFFGIASTLNAGR